MKVTKYPQSTILLEKDGKKILIDPGSFTASKYTGGDFGEIEAIFLTHRHPDHVDEKLIAEILSRKAVPVFANSDTKEAFPELVTQVVSNQETMQIAGFDIKTHELPHCALPDGSQGPPNTGYIFDGKFFHPGDGVETSGVSVEVLAAPIAGPDVSLRDAHDLIVATGASKVVPIHYTIFSDEKPQFAAGLVERFTPGIEMIVLGSGEFREF